MTARHSVAMHLILLFAAMPLFAYRREYLVMLEDARKAGSEVCFYRGDTSTALSLFFTSGKKGCLPADQVIDLPPGTFNFFARHKDGYVSVLRDYTIYDGPPIPEDQRIEIPLVRAGIVDAAMPAKSLQSGQSLGLWVAPTMASPGSFVPLIAGETTMLAPAGTPLLPMLVEDGLPVAIGDAVSVEAGSRIALPPFVRDKATTDVVAWLQLDKEAFHAARAVMPPPDVTLAAAGKTLKPQFSLFEPASRTLVIFRDVPRGPAELRLTGMMWRPVTRTIDVAGSVTVAREGLPMVAAGSVRVQWTAGGTEIAPPATCAGVSAADAPRVTVAILQCGNGTEQHCTPVAEASAPVQGNSSVSVNGVPAGSYIIALRAPLNKEQRFPVDVIAGQQQTISAAIARFNFFGTVTLNGAPIRAHLVFAGGEAVSDDTGRYTASLAAAPLGNNVRVELCGSDRWFDHFPAESIKANAPHDIDLRVRSLSIHVTDPQNRSMKDAAVSLCIVKRFADDGRTPLACRHSYPAGVSDERGDLVVEVPAGFPLQVCAAHKGFSRQCSMAMQSDALVDGRAFVRFEPAGLRGRVENHSGQGMLTFVAPAGQTTEDVQLDADGTFVTRLPHAPPEYFVYASSTRPLTVLPMPVLSSDEFDVTLPAAPVRRFTVTVPDMTAKSGFVGVWIGGLYVPLLTMDFHETSRGIDSILYRGKSVEFRDISETGPIAVAFGAPPDAAAPQFVDIFTLPQFAGIERHEVRGPALTLRP